MQQQWQPIQLLQGGGAAVAGNPAAAGGGTAVTLTPVKGKFQGSCTVSVANTAGQVIVPNTVQAINANGTTTITLPTGATGPFLISISGAAGNTCQYFNDNQANPQFLTLLPSQSLNALIASTEVTSASGVALTAITEMAYQAAFAVNGRKLTGLTDTSPAIAQGRAAAVSLGGLTTGASAVASIFTPPATIPAPGVAATDSMGQALVNIANLNGTNPMNAVNLMSLHAASAVGVPPSAAAIAALPTSPVGQGAAFLAQLATNGATAALNATNAAATVAFLADVTTTGLRQIQFGAVNPMFNINIPATASLIKATLANTIYTATSIWNNLLTGVWTPASSGNWVLGNKGWIDSATAPRSFAMNPDGTAKLTTEGYGTQDQAVFKKDLTGYTFASAVTNQGGWAGVGANGQVVLDASGVPTAANVMPAGAFTAGAIGYNLVPAGFAATYALNNASGFGAISAVIPASSVAFMTQDSYQVSTVVNNWNTPAVNTAGASLTTLPATNSAFCLQNNSAYYQPGVAAGTYDVFYTGGGTTCWPPAAGTLPGQTFTATTVVVNGVSIMELTAPATAFTPSWTNILAVINGKVYQGSKLAKGSPVNFMGSRIMANQAAATQLSTALNLPMF